VKALKTKVAVHFNGASNFYRFAINKETFMRDWESQIFNLGFYSATDEKGVYVVINPSQCGGIEITEHIE
jgi:hypothetical protein